MNGTDGNAAAGMAAMANGVASDDGTEWTLPSGKVAKMRPGTGRDIQRASRIVDTQKDGGFAVVMATAALKTTVDGRPLTYEDLLDLDDNDCWDIIGKSQVKKTASPPTT
jgi:hypothetical protein